MHVDLNKPAFQLDGVSIIKDEEQKEITLGRVVAGIFANLPSSKGNIIKHYDWAKTLYIGKELNLDREDYRKFREVIESSEVNVLLIAQILEILDTLKE